MTHRHFEKSRQEMMQLYAGQLNHEHQQLDASIMDRRPRHDYAHTVSTALDEMVLLVLRDPEMMQVNPVADKDLILNKGMNHENTRGTIHHRLNDTKDIKSTIHNACESNNFLELKQIFDNGFAKIENFFKFTSIDNDDHNSECIFGIAIKNESYQCVEVLSNAMLNYIEDDMMYVIDYNGLKHAIMHDLDTLLSNMLVKLLQKEGINNLNSYHENKTITFEFIFHLLKLSVLANNPENRSGTQLVHVLNMITAYCSKLQSSQTILNHNQYKDSMRKLLQLTKNTQQYCCIICLKPITMLNATSGKKQFNHCVVCDYCICQQCAVHQVE